MFRASIGRLFRSNYSRRARFSNHASSVPEFTNTERFVKNLPLIGVCIGSVALTFQLVILYPWHDELSEQFDDLQRTVISLEETATQLENRMKVIVTMENEVKFKERRILTTADDILTAEHTMADKLDLVLKNIQNN